MGQSKILYPYHSIKKQGILTIELYFFTIIIAIDQN